MSSGKPKRFRGDLWYNSQVGKRTREALQKKNEQFETDHREDSDTQLLDYVRKCAAELGHSPASGEIIGGAYIRRRFGDWQNVLSAAGLSPALPAPAPTHRAIYKQEFKRQALQFSKERKEIKQEKAERRRKETSPSYKKLNPAQQRAESAWINRHRGDSDEMLLDHIRKRAEKLGRSPYLDEVIGGRYLAARFSSWAAALQIAELPLPEGMDPPDPERLEEYWRKKAMADTETQ